MFHQSEVSTYDKHVLALLKSHQWYEYKSHHHEQCDRCLKYYNGPNNWYQTWIAPWRGTFQLKIFHNKLNLNYFITLIPCLWDQKQRLKKKESRTSEHSTVEAQIYCQAGLYFFFHFGHDVWHVHCSCRMSSVFIS